MKIKTLYIYGILAVILIAALLFVVTSQNQTQKLATQNMPQDSAHKQLNNKPPDKNNVSPQFYQELEVLRKDVEKNPKDTLKLRQYADYLTAAHQFDGAIPAYEDILSVNPKRTDIYFALTFIYFNKKDFVKAEEMSSKVLSYDKNNLQAQYNLGAIAATNGDNQKAKDIWTKLSEQHPETKEGQMSKSSLERLK